MEFVSVDGSTFVAVDVEDDIPTNALAPETVAASVNANLHE